MMDVHQLGLRKRDADELQRAAGSGNVYDILWRLPLRHENRRRVTLIKDVSLLGEDVLLRVTITARKTRVTKTGKGLLQLRVADESGELDVSIFNTKAAKVLRVGTTTYMQGRADIRGGRVSLSNIYFDPLKDEGDGPLMVPVYRGAAGIPARRIRVVMARLVDALAALPDPVPLELRLRHETMPLLQAFRIIHSPDATVTESRIEEALRSLTHTEAFLLAAAMKARQAVRLQGPGAYPLDITEAMDAQIAAVMGMTPTPDQRRAINDCREDFRSGRPMRRLLQGDVGSGKSLVALWVAAFVALAGGQVAILAPTDLLARQHFRFMRPRLEALGVPSGMLLGATRPQDRRFRLQSIAVGNLPIVIGTHALLEPDVRFQNLRLAVIDEQHKFGVRQRETLVEKGVGTHVMVTTATPVPRTLALALHGDLDISVIRTRPPGRGPVETRVVPGWALPRVVTLMRLAAQRGEFVYVVCPAVDENDETGAAAVESVADMLELTSLATDAGRILRLHGGMSAVAKTATMADFSEGRGRVLVSSTVVEVGVDVRDATLMVILDAGRFGLTQLHQLRGRIGRGPKPSCCILVSYDGRREAFQRLTTLCATSDGFAVAEADLGIRGPGEFFADRQHGAARLRVLDLAAHLRWIDTAFSDFEEATWGPVALAETTQQAVTAHFGGDVTFSSAAGG